MQAEQALNDLRTLGFHIARDAVPTDRARHIATQVRPLLNNTPFGSNSFVGTRTKRIHSVYSHTRAVDELTTHPPVLEVVAERLGHCLLSASVLCEIHPGETAQAPHTDDGIYPLPPDFRDIAVSALWALDDFTADNGGTIVFPGHFGDRGAKPDPAEAVHVEMTAGSLLLYTGTLWHGGGANVTDAPRLGLILTYIESWLRPQDSHLISVPLDDARQLSPELRSLLGYSMRPPFLGYVDGRDPAELFGDPTHDLPSTP